MDPRMVRAREAEAAGKFEPALSAYRDILKERPATVLSQAAGLKMAITVRARKKKADQDLRGYLAALDARFDGQFETAREKALRVVKEFPQSTLRDDAEYFAAYVALADLNDLPVAIEGFEAFIKSQPKSAYVNHAWYGLGSALDRSGRTKDAERTFDALKKLHTSFSALGIEIARNSVVSKLWYAKSQRALERLKRKREIKPSTGAPVSLGMGNQLVVDQPRGSGSGHRAVWHILRERGFSVSHLTHWITRSTDWRWESPDVLLASARNGHTPVVAYWYFGDEISPAYVKKHREAYFADIRDHLIPLLRSLPEVFVLLEPEFNKNGIERWDEWGDIAREAIREIKTAVPGAKVGLTVGNWGEFEQEDFLDNVEDAIDESDFVGLMAMTSNVNEGANLDPSWDVVERGNRLVAHLRKRFEKPIYFGYVAVPSAANWEAKQASYVRRYLESLPFMAANGVFAFSFFSLFDDPQQTGWFLDAEKTFGLLRADGSEKPAFNTWATESSKIAAKDVTPPKVIGSAKATRLKDGRRVEIAAELSEWSRWTVEVTGDRSGARFVASGAGSAIRFEWDGRAAYGTFRKERCKATLRAVDAAGNVTAIRRFVDLAVEQPPTTVAMNTPNLDPTADAVIWAPQFGSLRTTQSGLAVALETDVGPNGLSVSLDGFRAVDVRADRSNAFIEFVLTSKSPTDGLYVGLEDAAGVRTELIVDAFVVPTESGEPQRISIPLARFRDHGWRHTQGRREWRKLDWKRLQRFSLVAVSQPMQFDLAELQLSRLTRAGQVLAN